MDTDIAERIGISILLTRLNTGRGLKCPRETIWNWVWVCTEREAILPGARFQ
jgi:hypothetical protein